MKYLDVLFVFGLDVLFVFGDLIKIDILSSGEIPDEINGIKLASVKGLINAKKCYCQQSNEQSEKHRQDLIFLESIAINSGNEKMG